MPAWEQGDTGKMVEPVAEGIRGEGAEAQVLPVERVTMVDMRAADGLIIQGKPFGPHYGPVALGESSAAVLDSFRTWGARWAKLVRRLRDGRTATLSRQRGNCGVSLRKGSDANS